MRWRIVWVIPWLLAALPAALLTQVGTAQDDNLLVNGGFEDGSTGWLAIDGELSVSDAFVHGGTHAGLLVTPNPMQDADAEATQCVPVVPFTDYEFQGYVARGGARPGALHLRVSWYGQDDCFGEKVGGGPDEGSAVLEEVNRWYEIVVEARSPAAARGARLRLVVEEADAIAYLDDFAVSNNTAPTQTPTVEPSASATPTATPRPPVPSPSATAHVSPTASSWQMTPVPVQSALRNGGFEEADPQGVPSFWHNYGGELARTNEVRFEGHFAAALTSQTNTTKWAYQLVTVQGGRAYVLGAYVLKAAPAVAAAYLRLSWYADPGGSGQAIDSADSTAVLADDSPEFRFLTTEAVVAPAEAASAKVRLMLDPASEEAGSVYFDAVTFEETALPERTLAPTAIPPIVADQAILTPTPSTFVESASTPRAERRGIPLPTDSATTPRPSPAGPSAGGKPTPAALAAVRAPATPSATAAAAVAAAARVPASVYRQRKPDTSMTHQASERAESGEGGLLSPLLALAAGIPALAGASAAAYYWRWRRARLR